MKDKLKTKNIKKVAAKRKFPAMSRQGAFVMLFGFLCPAFWVALFTGTKADELVVLAIHSGGIVLIGLVVMIIGLLKK